MRLGAILPNSGPLTSRYGIAAMAQAAEAAGAQSLWVDDHLLMVDSDTSGYPYSDDGRITWSVNDDYYEALTCCSFLAALTSSSRIGIAVLVLPQRNVLEVAKIAASIDRLCGGRFVLGVGAGWYEAEMAALGYSFAERGVRLDEMLQVLRSCWTGRPEAFSGSQLQIRSGIVMKPVPLQVEGPPVLVGGMTPPALRRAARLGDGWLALEFAGRFDRESLSANLRTIRRFRTVERGAREFVTVLKLHAESTEARRLLELVREVQDLGFDELVIEPPWADGTTAATDVIRAALDLIEVPAGHQE